MSTFIQGITDYIPEIQKYQPNFDLFKSIIETRQSLYDEAKERIADVYNTVLNSPMTREEDLKKREVFFKQIDDDIKKISRTDLSLKQNQAQAAHIFTQFLDDKNIAHDMVFTRQAHKALETGERLRESGDKGYWQGMSQNINYALEAYKNSDNETALGMTAPKYIKRVDIMDEIMDKVKEMNFDITEETPYETYVDKNGKKHTVESKWIVKRKNGSLIEPYLLSIFSSEYATRGDVMDYYSELAKNNRYNWVYQNAENYGGIEQANQEYVNNVMPKLQEEYQKQFGVVKTEEAKKKEQIANTRKALETARQSNSEGSIALYEQKLSEYIDEFEKMQISKGLYEQNMNKINNGVLNHTTADTTLANILYSSDLYNAVGTASMIGAEVSYSENPYKKLEYEYSLKMKYEDHKAELERKKKKEEEGEYDTMPVIPVKNIKGSQAGNEDERGTNVFENFTTMKNDLFTPMKSDAATILQMSFEELKNIAKSDDPDAWRAKEVVAGMIANTLPDDEQKELWDKYGGDYNGWYKELSGKDINFASLDTYKIMDSFDKLKTLNFLTTTKRPDIQPTYTSIRNRVDNLNSAWTGRKHDVSGYLETLTDEEQCIVKSLMGIPEGKSVADWDGSISDFDEYFHTAQTYKQKYGLTEHTAVDRWEDKEVFDLFGKALDAVSSKTAYASVRGYAAGLDTKLSEGFNIPTVSNRIEDPFRKDVTSILQYARNYNDSYVYMGDFVEEADDVSDNRNEDALAALDRYATQLNNLYDGKSTTKYTFNITGSPITLNNKDLYGLHIFDPSAKQDSPDKNGITVAVPKELLRDKDIKLFDASDHKPYHDWLSNVDGKSIDIIEADNPSLKICNNGKQLTIGTDASGRIVTHGVSFTWDKDTGPEYTDFSRVDWGNFDADKVVSVITNAVYGGYLYAKQKGGYPKYEKPKN